MRGVCEASLLRATGRIIPPGCVVRGAWFVMRGRLLVHHADPIDVDTRARAQPFHQLTGVLL